jgi:CheY-like chemotaxis protein
VERCGHPAPLHAGGRILLVDDEPVVLSLVGEMLERLGYRVVPAQSPSEALALAESEPDLDLLVTDVAMPELSGPELARQLIELRPGLRVAFMSADPTVPGVEPDDLLAGAPFLRKPFTLDELAAAVREALGR